MSVMQVFNESVPKAKYSQFHDILCATGGRYLANPLDCGDTVRVSYEPGDYRAQAEAWNRCTQPVLEVRKDQAWRRWLRRLGLLNK